MPRNLVLRDEPGELAHYDPKKGLKAVAVAEAAEKHFARAKDIVKLFEAIEAKLKEQRKFVLWWDGFGDKRGRPKEKTSQTGDVLPKLNKIGLDRDTVHRWRARLKELERFEATVATAKERARRVCEFEKGSTEQRGASGTGENEWHTPEKYLALARKVLGDIDLDPASTALAQKTVQAGQYFTKKDDGLKQEWHGRVWLNPPYAQPAIAQFVAKIVDEWNARHLTAAIMLTHNYTDTVWFHQAAASADAICFTRGRIGFIDPHGTIAAPTQGQAFFYFGQEFSRFVAEFAGVGFIVVPSVRLCDEAPRAA